jgi:hypothetical protein
VPAAPTTVPDAMETATSTRGRSPRSRVGLVVFIALVAWGLYQCYWNLTGANAASDESLYVGVGWQYVHGDLSQNLEHPPLVKYLLGGVQLLLHEGKGAARLLTTSFVFAIGWALFAWFRRELGFAWGVVVAALWWLLPRALEPSGIRLDRFALLEPYMAGFAVLSLAVGWWWFQTGRWWLAPLAGILMAFSVTSKVSTAILVLTFAGLGVAAARRSGLRRVVVPLVLYAVAFAATFVAVYLPVGLVSAIEYMLRFQAVQKEQGHAVVLNGQLVAHPPWWANLFFTEQALGPWLLAALCAAAVFAFVPRPSGLAIYLGAATVLLVVFYSVVVSNALAQYCYAWMWTLVALAAVGLRNLWVMASPFVRLRRRDGARPWILPRALVAVVLAVALVNAVTTSVAIAAERPTGFARVREVLQEHGQTVPGVLAAGYLPWQWRPYLRPRATSPVLTPSGAPLLYGAPFGAIAYRATDRPSDVGVAAFLRANASRLDHVRLDDVDLYVPKEGYVALKRQTLVLTK